MSDEEGVLSFSGELSALVAEVEDQMAAGNPPLDESGSGLDLSAVLMENNQCYQFAARVSASNVGDLGCLLDVVLSQEFGKYWFYIYFLHKS